MNRRYNTVDSQLRKYSVRSEPRRGKSLIPTLPCDYVPSLLGVLSPIIYRNFGSMSAVPVFATASAVLSVRRRFTHVTNPVAVEAALLDWPAITSGSMVRVDHAQDTSAVRIDNDSRTSSGRPVLGIVQKDLIRLIAMRHQDQKRGRFRHSRACGCQRRSGLIGICQGSGATCTLGQTGGCEWLIRYRMPRFARVSVNFSIKVSCNCRSQAISLLDPVARF